MSLSACDSDTPNDADSRTNAGTDSGAPPAPTPPPPAAPAALESITLSASTVVGQAEPTATIRLTAPAPAGNAHITLEATNRDVAKVPANVSVAAGATTNTFTVDTSTVRETTTVTINARYLGVVMTTVLTVVPPPLEAQFRVTSAIRGDDACVIVSAAGAVDCVFDASRSTGFPSQYRWTFTVAGKDLTVNMPESQASFTPATDCAFLSGGTCLRARWRCWSRCKSGPAGQHQHPMQRTIDLVPNGMCGY